MFLGDLDLSQGGIWVVDEMDGRIFQFSQDLRARQLRIRRGEGPNEVMRPVALAFSPSGDRFAVVDRGTGLLKLFDGDRSLVVSHRLPYPTEDVGISSDGSIYLSHVVVALPEYGDREQVAVSVLSPGASEFLPFITIAGDGLVPPRFPVRGPTRIRLEVASDRVAVWYPVGGVVDVFSARADRLAEIQACLPREIDAFYATQRESQEDRSFTFDLITDVRIGTGGAIETIGPKPDERGRYHVDRYSSEGRPLGSLVDRAPVIELPDQVRFLGSGNELGGFTRDGVVGTLSLRPLGVPDG